MSPKDFNWEESQQITVINPTKEDYHFKVYSQDYEVKAGAKAKMPGYMAWMFVYHLAEKICQKEHNFNRWNEEGYRQIYFNRLVVAVDDIMQEVSVEPEKVEAVEDAPKRGRPATVKP